MFNFKRALVYAFLLAVGFSGGHSYPKSGVWSGGGHSTSALSRGGSHGYPSSGGTHSSDGHGYPSSGDLSGGGSSGGAHTYPSSGGKPAYPSSGGSHGYPSSGGSHGYPSSGGSHGYPSSGGSHGYPSSGGSHGYPSSGGSHGNPSSGGSHGNPSSGGSHGYPSSGGSHGYPSSGGSHGYPSSGGSHGYPSSGVSYGYPSSGGSHGYPSSGGSHGYPSSGGSHGYPSSGGSHGYPSSGGSHGYPSSGGSYGYPSSGGSHGYPSSGGSHGYPSSGGSHGYPSSGGGLSGSHGYPQNKPAVHHTTNIHNYHYAPPQQISYSPVRGGAPVSYPVYHGTPPTYVYQYKNSDSKYGTLLAGLALLNLGTLGVAAYAASGPGKTLYTPQPGEVCKFEIRKDNGDFEQTKIDCQIISSFILQDQAQQSHTTGTNTSTSVVTVTNTTVMNMTNMMPDQPSTPGPVTPAIGNVLYAMLSNGTLVPANATGAPGVPVAPGNPLNVTQNVTGLQAQNGVVTSSVVTTTTTNTTLVNALDVKGKPVDVTPEMHCFVIRTSPTHNMRKNVPCGLLQTYADKSIQRKNSAARNGPMFTIVAAVLAFCMAY